MAHPTYPELATAALEARELAYAPYSHFAVGAAVLTSSGRVFRGGNIENAAYPMTCCAERVALFSAYAAGERTIVAIAVATPTDDVASPCGACRQVMIELAGDVPVLLLNTRGVERLTSTYALLPHGFGAAQLAEASSTE
jgi:cytidine deaminase